MRAPSPLLGRVISVVEATETHAWIVELGVDAFPFLADHQLRSVIVLPGAVMVEIALAVASEVAGCQLYAIHDLQLERVCVVPTSRSRFLRVALLADTGGGLSLSVASTSGGENPPIGTRHTTARITAITGPLATTTDGAERALNVRRTGSELSGDDLYATLGGAGVEYGPAFRTLRQIWRRGDEAFATIHSGSADAERQLGWWAHPTLIDASIQLLAAASDHTDKPFMWAGCADARVYGQLEADCQAYARSLTVDDSGEILGDIVIMSAAGHITAEISGARLHLLRAASGSSGHREPAAQRRPTIAIAATFNATAFGARLGGWMTALGAQVPIVVDDRARAVPEIANRGGVLASNMDGVNVLLVKTEEVYGDVCGRRDRLASGRWFTLPGFGDIAHLHSYETEFLYDEIFVQETYLRHGITLNADDIVFDVGANIGMFTLFAHQRCPGVRVYAFEPAKTAFEALQENTSQYCPGAQAFNCGISDGDRTLPFTFYRNSTVFSGFAADSERDSKAIRTVIENMLRSKVPTANIDLRPIVDRMLRDRLVADVQPVLTKTLSTVLRETGVQQIDLLKIDTEGSEIQVLKGIETQDWKRIRQVVLEVHGRADERNIVTAMLKEQGFRVTIDQQEHLLRGTALTTVFARRIDDTTSDAPEVTSSSRLIGPSSRRTSHLVEAVATLQRSVNGPCIVCLCPSHVEVTDDRRQQQDQADREFATALTTLPRVTVITAADIEQALLEDGGTVQERFFDTLAKLTARIYLNVR